MSLLEVYGYDCWFQQLWATMHYVNLTVQILRDFFRYRILLATVGLPDLRSNIARLLSWGRGWGGGLNKMCTKNRIRYTN